MRVREEFNTKLHYMYYIMHYTTTYLESAPFLQSSRGSKGSFPGVILGYLASCLVLAADCQLLSVCC